ncbi:hypothetical protein ACGYLM_01585 [Sulfitobacter sp. 1A10445]
MEALNEINTIVTIAATVTGGVIVALGNLYLNSRGVTLNVQKAANEAASAVVADMRDLISELRAELKRKDEIIDKMTEQVKNLRRQVADLRKEMHKDTKEVIQAIKDK